MQGAALKLSTKSHTKQDLIILFELKFIENNFLHSKIVSYFSKFYQDENINCACLTL